MGWLRILAWGAAGLIVLYLLYFIASVILSIVFTAVKLAILLGIAAIVLAGAYYLVSAAVGGSGTGDRSRERERIFE